MFRKLTIIAVALMFLNGCTMISIKGAKRIEQVVPSIQKNETNKQEILSLLGNPLEISHRDNNEDIYVYERVETSQSIPKYCWAALPLSLGLWFPCYVVKVKSDVMRLSLNIEHDTGVVLDYNVDNLAYDGPYYRTAAEAADAAARQASAAALNHHYQAQTVTYPSNTYYRHR